MLKQILETSGAIITGTHLVLSSGRHSDAYINMRVLAGNTEPLSILTSVMAEAIIQFEDNLLPSEYPENQRIVIVGPETLGRTMAEFVALSVNDNWHNDVYFAWCDMKKADNHEWAEWNPKLNLASIVKDARCYIIDDLLTTAKSVKLVKQLVEASGGIVIGVLTAVRRDPAITCETIGVQWLYTMLDIQLETYEPSECPLCAQNIPMQLRPGHDHEWIKSHPDYPTTD